MAFFGKSNAFVRIGDGEIGGKAQGLVFFRDMLRAEFDPLAFPQIDVGVPSFAVIATDVFDAALEDNGLVPASLSTRSDGDIARAFRQARLPEKLTRRLEALLDEVRGPLAVRSSSLSEDAALCPLAGVYATKMIPNNQATRDGRLKALGEAIKFVYASTFFEAARRYLYAGRRKPEEEKMAVIVQEVVGDRHGDRFYPHLSGVGRSHNFYPSVGARAEDGVIMLALGLGKTIVEGGLCWSHSPSRPQAPPPYGSVGEMLKNSQLSFWYLDLACPPGADPMVETEYMVQGDLRAAERDGTLALVASTYDSDSDRLVPGTGPAGPRLVNFAPLLTLNALPLNELLKTLLSIGERAAGKAVEVEFAVNLPGPDRPRAQLGFLQLRPMFVSAEEVEISRDEWEREDVLLASERVMGNGRFEGIRDVVFVKPECFEARFTRAIATEIQSINASLVGERRPYLLIGFGRWGSADPWLGVPVDWGQISGARVIVEATTEAMNVEPSQGSHFFHNISGLGVSYLSVRHGRDPEIDWSWLDSLPVVRDERFVRQVRLEAPLNIKVDGRSGRGAVWGPRGEPR